MKEIRNKVRDWAKSLKEGALEWKRSLIYEARRNPSQYIIFLGILGFPVGLIALFLCKKNIYCLQGVITFLVMSGLIIGVSLIGMASNRGQRNVRNFLKRISTNRSVETVNVKEEKMLKKMDWWIVVSMNILIFLIAHAHGENQLVLRFLVLNMVGIPILVFARYHKEKMKRERLAVNSIESQEGGENRFKPIEQLPDELRKSPVRMLPPGWVSKWNKE